MRPAFSTIKQYLAAIERKHYHRRMAFTKAVKAAYAEEARRIADDLGAVLDRIIYDKALFARWARNDRNQGLASRQNAWMWIHAVQSKRDRPMWLSAKLNYKWSREHHV